MSVRNALLGLLEQRPRHGYELHDAFEAMAGGEDNWDVKPAQVYATLARLEPAGLIVQVSLYQIPSSRGATSDTAVLCRNHEIVSVRQPPTESVVHRVTSTAIPPGASTGMCRRTTRLIAGSSMASSS